MSEPVAWTLAREGGELVYAVSSREAAEAWAANTNYHAAPIYTTDAIREAVERERQEIILVLKDELFSEEEVLFVKGYNGGIRNALEVIKARGAA